jgi:glycosyltransferase involved in cell wall biosynthesis
LASWAHVRSLLALVALMKAEKPSLVHAHMPISGFLARLAARIAYVPRVAATSHGFLFNQPGFPPRRAMAFGAEWLAGRWTDIFLTVSREEARDARRLGIARAPVVVGNGRDPDVFHPDPSARARLRDALGVPGDRVVVITVARLVRHKGFPELAAAMRAVPGAELWVVGDRLPSDRGPDMAAVLRAAGLGARLRMLGMREDVAALLAAADIFVLASHFEGLPMSVIEAKFSALPVVACDIRGPREQVVDGETGFLVPPGDVGALAAAIRRLAEAPALRAAMGAAGRARAMQYYQEADVLARTLDALGL